MPRPSYNVIPIDGLTGAGTVATGCFTGDTARILDIQGTPPLNCGNAFEVWSSLVAARNPRDRYSAFRNGPRALRPSL